MSLFRGFQSRAELGMRPPRSRSTNVAPERGGLVIHYAGPTLALFGHDNCIAHWLAFQRYHMDTRDWVDVAYSAGFCIHGYALAGRGYGVRTAANGTDDANYRYLAIVFVGGEQQMTPAASAAAWWLIHEFRSLGAADGLEPHNRFRQTACPGDVHHYVVNNYFPPEGDMAEGHNPIRLKDHELSGSYEDQEKWTTETWPPYVERGLTTIFDTWRRVVHRRDLGWLYTKAIKPLEETARDLEGRLRGVAEWMSKTEATLKDIVTRLVALEQGDGGGMTEDRVREIVADTEFVYVVTPAVTPRSEG